MSRILLVVIVAGVSLFTASTVRGQSGNSCDDPFPDGRPRFLSAFWERTDFCKTQIEWSELLSGGVPPDGIPPIDDPLFETIADAATWLADQSPVIAVEIDGSARAYPLAILTWHEIVNDTLSETPIAVTFCPLCNSAIVYERTVDGEVLRFGVSGLLRNSDLVMWDDVTQSFWQQLTGEGLVGVHTGTQLQHVSSQVVGFADFAAEYPDGEVLSRETGIFRRYGDNPYVGYDSTTQPFLFTGEVDPRLPATAHVLGALVDGVPVAYPYDALAEAGVINDEINGRPVAAFWQGGVTSALDAESIDASRDVGTAALYSRALDDGRVLTFSVDEDGDIRDGETNSVWNAFGRAMDGELIGAQLFREIGGPHFWFAWAAFYPQTELVSE